MTKTISTPLKGGKKSDDAVPHDIPVPELKDDGQEKDAVSQGDVSHKIPLPELKDDGQEKDVVNQGVLG